MASASTVTNTLRPEFRFSVLFVWLLACVVLGWVSLIDAVVGFTTFAGIFALLGSGWLVFIIHDESALAWNHLLAYGDILSRKTTRHGIELQYRFVVADGCTYEKTEQLGKWKRARVQRLPVLYNPLKPMDNKLLDAFIFYRFNLPK